MEVQDAIKRCSKAVFVFEEVDKYPPKVFDEIKSFLQYDIIAKGYEYREAIFIFITTIGQEQITNIALQKIQDGVQRKDFAVNDFKEALKLSFFNDEEKGQTDVIDYFVPFLPLERIHLMQCIKAEVYRQGGNSQMSEGASAAILSEVTYEPDNNPIFSNNGCKRISEKVAFLIEKDRRKNRRNSEF